MNCPTCGMKDYYLGFSSKGCISRSCREYLPLSEEIEETTQPINIYSWDSYKWNLEDGVYYETRLRNHPGIGFGIEVRRNLTDTMYLFYWGTDFLLSNKPPLPLFAGHVDMSYKNSFWGFCEPFSTFKERTFSVLMNHFENLASF